MTKTHTARRPRWGRAWQAAAAVCVAAGAALTVVGGASPAAAATSPVVSLPVSFTVKNTNHTSVACLSDGKTYTIRGHITGTKKSLVAPKSVALYLHAVTQGEFYWRFNGVPGYNVADQMAATGHVSVTIDRLGYGASDKPPGLSSCFGSQADTAHQVIQQLRSGAYTTTGTPYKFSKVFLVGHSAGGLIGTIEAYTFHDIDGFVNFGWSDTTTSLFLTTQLATTELRCVLSPLGLGTKGNPRNYEAFGDNPAGILFHSASPAVRASVPKANPDPCGDLLSIPAALVADVLGVPRTTAPVLIIAGANDALFPNPDMQLQKLRYTGSKDVTLKQYANTAHGFNYEATHAESVAYVGTWLAAHGG